MTQSSSPHRILIVEDQALIAMMIEDAVLALGYQIAGVAASLAEVVGLASQPDIALVDVNLVDGPTGPTIGRELARGGTAVIFMTANPEVVEGGVEGAIGVISKPVHDLDLISTIEYAAKKRLGLSVEPPRNLLVFAR